MDMTELKERGWTLIDGIKSHMELLDIGKLIGCPVPAPNGELIKEIRGMSAAEATPGSQSSIYGTGSFPLHIFLLGYC